MNGSNGMNGSMSTNGATAKGDAMGTVPAATPKFTDSPEQAAVIQAPSYEDVVVVAGAGSGKTYTMTRRIITLIDQGISPEKILGLTFTRKAASELLSRVSAAVTRNQAGRGTRVAFLKPEVSTYDAFFQTIVRQYGLLVGFDQNTQPLSEAGALQLIHTVLDKHMDQLHGLRPRRRRTRQILHHRRQRVHPIQRHRRSHDRQRLHQLRRSRGTRARMG